MNKNIRYRFIHANKNLFISKSDIFFSISDIVFIRYFNQDILSLANRMCKISLIVNMNSYIAYKISKLVY